MTELKPCPFCNGNDAKLIWVNDEGEETTEQEIFEDITCVPYPSHYPEIVVTEDDEIEDLDAYEKICKETMDSLKMIDYAVFVGVSCPCGCSLVCAIRCEWTDDQQAVDYITRVWNRSSQ